MPELPHLLRQGEKVADCQAEVRRRMMCPPADPDLDQLMAQYRKLKGRRVVTSCDYRGRMPFATLHTLPVH